MAFLLVPVSAAVAVAAGVWALQPRKPVVPLGGLRVPGKRVCVIMFSTPNIVDQYAGLAARVNLAYARRHGYAFEHIVKPSTTLMPQWEKVRVLRDALDSYEAVFWIDSDAAFNQHETSLERWLQSDADIVGCTDVPNGPYSINTGTLLVKRTPWTRMFLEVWWSMRQVPKYQQWAFEQEAMHDLILTDAMRCVTKGKIVMEPHDSFNSSFDEIVRDNRRDTFVLHFMACPAAYRQKELTDLCRRTDTSF